MHHPLSLPSFPVRQGPARTLMIRIPCQELTNFSKSPFIHPSHPTCHSAHERLTNYPSHGNQDLMLVVCLFTVIVASWIAYMQRSWPVKQACCLLCSLCHLWRSPSAVQVRLQYL